MEEFHCEHCSKYTNHLDTLSLSVRAKNCLVNMGINTVDELINTPKEKLYSIKNFGMKCMWEIHDALKDKNIVPHFCPNEFRFIRSSKGLI